MPVNQAIMQIRASLLAGDLNAVAAGCCRAGPDDRCPTPPNADRCPDLPMSGRSPPISELLRSRIGNGSADKDGVIHLRSAATAGDRALLGRVTDRERHRL
jgi:hypothetical protein